MRKVSITCVLLFSLLGCEDVIQIDAPAESPRLVVDALLRIDTNEPYFPVRVRVSLTDGFFGENKVTRVESIIIIREHIDNGIVISSVVSNLAEEAPGTGIYVPDPNFSTDQRIPIAEANEDVLFTLLIEHKGRVYAGQTRYVPTVPIDSLVRGNKTLFNDDDTELIVTFTDDPDRDNFYVFDFGFGEYLVSEDEFFQGQEFQFSYFYDRQFEPSTELEVRILGADPTFYNYMDQLIEQSGDTQNPFQTPVATVRGNVFDVTGLDNNNIKDNVDRPDRFALGYFGIVQEYKKTITIN